MRALPAALTSELNTDGAKLGHLLEIVFDNAIPASNFYFTDIDGDVVYDSGAGYGVQNYLSRGIKFNQAKYSLLPRVDSMTFEIDNVSLEMSSLVQTKDTRGRDCVIYRAAFGHTSHSTNKNPFGVIAAVPMFVGLLDTVNINGMKAEFQVLSQMVRWNMPTPRRKHGSRCWWTFKDPATCKYAGGLSSCDKTWGQCTTRGNTANYGGFRWLPALVDKEVKWGRA